MRCRVLALLLVPEALAVAGWGAWLLASTWLGERAPRGRTGDVIGPPDAWIDGALAFVCSTVGIAAVMLGVLGLAAGARIFRAGPRPWVAAPLLAFMLPWSVLALWSLMRMYGAEEPTGWIALFVAAAGIGLGHAPAARACWQRTPHRA